jgi:ribosomal protein L4
MASFAEYTRKKKKESIENISFNEYTRFMLGDDVIIDDIAPIQTTTTLNTTTAKKEEEEKEKWYEGWFKKSEGNVAQSILGSTTDLVENIGTGLIGMGEKAIDGLMALAPAFEMSQKQMNGQWITIEDWEHRFEQEKEIQEFIQKDLYDESEVAKKIISAPVKNVTGVDSETMSVFDKKSDSLAQSVGQLGGTIALQATGVPWWLTTGTTSLGSEMENASKQGADYDEALMSGLITAGGEILTEKLFGAISFGGKTLDEVTIKPLTEKISNKAVKTLVNLGIDAVGEGSEEVISQVISNLGTSLYKEENLKELLTSEEALDGYIESFIGGAFLGGGMSTINTLSNKNKNSLTENEQKVVDAEVESRVAEREKGDKKLSEEEIQEIKAEVRQDLDRGQISLDTIESVLGGETYNTYKSMVEQENSLKEEIKALESDPRPTAQNRLEEARAELEAIEKGTEKNELKERLSIEVQELTKSDRLSESYNEKLNRSKKFEADLSKYDAKTQETVKKAVESGILNNTRKTHDFVELLAKLSTEKGVSFDFTNNENLKKSGFALEGVTVNGLVNGNDVVLNVDSQKALNTVVGHEITHVLESSPELYNELQTVIEQLAKTKGEYDSRFEAISKLYEGRFEGTPEEIQKKLKKELTADLVGDYLFTDSDFINNLSTQKPNIFKKIYEEIKYLYKVATAGSKEARELEKVKRVFDKVYKESKSNNTATEYSLEKTSDGTEYVKTDKDLFVKEDGTLMTEKEVFDSLIGHEFTLPEGNVKVASRLPGKSMYQELYKRRPNYKGVEDIKQLNSDVNYNMEELLDNSKIKKSNVPDANGKHSKQGIDSFDTRTVNFYDGNKSYTIDFSIANLSNGEKVAYAKKFFGLNEDLTKKIQASETMGEKSQLDQKTVSEDIVSQNQENATENVKKLTKEQEEYFKDSVVRDENGNLKPMYHGTSKGGHTVFDPYGASKYGLFGVGSYFTDNKSVAESYTEKGKGNNKQIYETYLNITNPIDMDMQANPEAWKKALPDANFPESGTNEDFYRAMEEYLADNEYAKWEASEVALETLESMGYDGITHIGGGRFNKADDTRHQVYIAFHSEQIKNTDNTNPTTDADIRYSLSEQALEDRLSGDALLDAQDLIAEIEDVAEISPNGYVTLYHRTTPENAKKIMESGKMSAKEDGIFFSTKNDGANSIGYGDGVVKVKIPVEKLVLDDIFSDEAHLRIPLKSRKESLDVSSYLVNTDARYSMSTHEQNIAPIGNYNVYGKDIALEAPVQTVAKAETPTQEAVVDEFAPLTEAQANERDAMQSDRLFSLNESDMPEEVEAPVYEEPVEAESPFDEKDIQDVGNRKVNAYMYENPEVKPYFQEEAQVMLGELRNSIKGEKSFNDQLYYDSNGEQGWYGTKRETSEQIAYMLDRFKYTYADIEKGLNAIIEDHGAENNAISKRLEFMIDERLREGYTDFASGYEIPSNQEYINLLNEKQIREYSDEAYNKYLESLAFSEAVEDIAPAKGYEAIEPKPQDLDKLEAQWAKNKMSRVDSSKKAEYEAIAKVLDTEPVTESDRNSRKWAIFRANVLDKGSVFEDLALKTKNRDLMGKWNYTLYSEARAQRLMGNGDAEAGVKSLNDIRAEVENTGLTKQFYEYMYHKHNVDRMKLAERYSTEENPVENKPVFGYSVTAEKSQEIVDQYEFAQPEFMDYAKDVYNYQNYLRQQLVDNGVISQETADLWSDMYPHYVPIRRVTDSNANKIDIPLLTGRTSVNAPIKKATGGNTDILPLFDTMAMRTIQTYKATAKNSFGVELKNTLGTTVEKGNTDIDEVIDSIDAQESLLQEGKNGSKPTFTVFENGERVTFEITEDMYDAFKPISDSSMLSKTIKPLNVASNFHRGLLTEYNPVFILTNGIKDIQDVLINSQHAIRTYAKMPEAFAQLTTKGYWYNEYMNNGGDSNSYFDSDTNTFKTENKGLAKLLDIPPLSTISKLNNYVEMIPRLAEYIASREVGRSIETSMLDSARVTTNFRAGGDLTKFLNRNGATFLNASVQGAMQQVRNVREAQANGIKGWANLATKFAIAGLPAFLLNSLLWDDDEEYEELSDYVKQNYYVVWKYDDGKFVRIPKGRTVAVIQDAIKQISDLATGNDEADLKSFLQLVVTNLAPANPIENNILAPITQVMNNETWYGEDLVPTRLQDLPASEQYDESTDIFSKWLGGKLDISPVKINYLLDQYSGGLGDVVLPMLTPEAESGDNSFAGNMIAPLKKKFTVDSVINNQNVSDFYETSEELTTNAKMSTATEEDVLMNKYINSVKGEMSDLYKKKREIQSSNLSDSEKYAQVREVQSQIVELSKEGLKSYKGVEINGNYATVGDRHYKRSEDGEWTKVTDKQLEKQEEVTTGLGISASDYWSNKDEYDYAYEKPEKYAMTKALGGYDTYKGYTSALNDIKADKDEEGKSISGSRKEKVIQYVDGLNADYGEKIILFKSEYPSDDTYNEDIIEYLNNREDITYSEMELILKELGFTVEADGTVRW